ncbi:Mitochondrial inner membrane protein oxa1-2 [Galdieria sulphuraria]|uniref:Preprotein translocase, Oxa1 family n=1 Tax=Galdieria sulphuraria TaxID=130081 RepID=M2Y260_GALSU|nr:preprotein translocase, Oxa1 family [Galdieria sulphuraria]EME29894.1 preprotein translocase, Oxa1 family [Galdieria sulphuraria]GJD11942.1 Mitochondrial inner membrane protein oxa1-2 [Galdieria sulphuraria]|eukprot:XP_005706414.1 preprotein translocase, Oxa1 family [Galdieria sulphuraria]
MMRSLLLRVVTKRIRYTSLYRTFSKCSSDSFGSRGETLKTFKIRPYQSYTSNARGKGLSQICSLSTSSSAHPSPKSGQVNTVSEPVASNFHLENASDNLGSLDSLPNQALEEIESNWFDPMVYLIHRLHEATGWPWFALLAGMTWSIRLMMLPLTLGSLRTSALLNSLQPQLKDIQDKISRAKERGNSEKVEEYNKKYMEILRVNKANPMKALFAPLAQTPVFIAFFFSLRKLSQIEPTFSSGGTLWFTDLSAPDPYYILPVACSSILLTTLQFGGETASTATSRTAFNMMRLMALSIIPFTYQMPSALFCYWVPNNLFSLAQTLLFKVPTVRKVLKLPDKRKKGDSTKDSHAKQDEQTTFDHLYSQAGSKAEREALAALSYNSAREGTNPILVAAKQGMKPRLLEKKTRVPR